MMSTALASKSPATAKVEKAVCPMLTPAAP